MVPRTKQGYTLMYVSRCSRLICHGHFAISPSRQVWCSVPWHVPGISKKKSLTHRAGAPCRDAARRFVAVSPSPGSDAGLHCTFTAHCPCRVHGLSIAVAKPAKPSTSFFFSSGQFCVVSTTPSDQQIVPTLYTRTCFAASIGRWNLSPLPPSKNTLTGFYFLC